MSHFVNVCEYGWSHGGCRCPSDDTIKMVECNNSTHADIAGPYLDRIKNRK